MTTCATDPDQLLTTKEAAKLLGFSPSSLDSDRSRRIWEIPYVRIGGAIRYRRSDLIAFIESRVQRAGGAS